MKNSRLFLIGLFVFFFLFSNAFIYPQHSSAANLSWSPVSIPSGGSEGKWVLADGSDVRCLTAASNGYLYCCANPLNANSMLFKSTDSGFSWSETGNVEDTIVDIAASPVNENYICFATSTGIFVSNDAGASFPEVGSNPSGGVLEGLHITSLDVVALGGFHHIVVSLCNNNPVQYGGVYILDESDSLGWKNLNIGNYDVYSVAFSPDFEHDNQIVAVASNELDTIITVHNGSGWGLAMGNARILGLVPEAAAIPDNQLDQSLDKSTQFIAIDTGLGIGDVYRVDWQTASPESIATDLNIGSNYGLDNLDVTSLMVAGDSEITRLMAGVSDSSNVYISNNGGDGWSRCSKPPSGDRETYVLMSSDFISTGIAYAATGGAESAFSITRDGGVTWNQIGLIDTRIASIRDLAISPNYDQDNSLFMITSNVQDSIWYSSNGGSNWERRYCTTEDKLDRIHSILLSLDYSLNQTLLMAGTMHNNPVIWKSKDNGVTFSKNDSIDPVTGARVPISTWALAPGDILFVGSYIDNQSLIYKTDAGSQTYIHKTHIGDNELKSIAISPYYLQDRTLLVGDTYGAVSYSDTGGYDFNPLPYESGGLPSAGNVTVTFDAGFRQNKTVYSASDNANSGIYRFIIGQSLDWESIGSDLPEDAIITKLVSSDKGILYAVNFQQVDNLLPEGGIERSCDPLKSDKVPYETVIEGLNDGDQLKNIWIQGNNLWTIDTTNARLLVYSDLLASPIVLESPADSSSLNDLDNVSISWKSFLEGIDSDALPYYWQVDTDNRFLDIPSGFEGNTDLTSIKLDKLAPNTVYYWRVRASYNSVTSPWSSVWSFNTNTENQLTAPALVYPGTGSNYPVNPVFKWNTVEGADKYDLLVSEFDNFANPVIDKSGANACNTNAWANATELKYATSYYWKVRAVNAETAGPWSSTSIFTTKNKSSSGGSSSSGSGSEKPSPVPMLAKPVLSEPKLNAQVAVQPVFKWSTVAGAEAYELMVSKDDYFSILAINKTGDNICHANVWKCDISLEYSMNYYWKVRALGGGKTSDWSSVSIFGTESEPVSTPSSPSPTPPMKSPETSPVNSSSTPVGNNSTSINLTSSPGSPVRTIQPGATGFSSIPSSNTSAVSEVTLSNSAVWQIFFIFGGLIILIGISSFGVITLSRKFKRNQ